jgi:RES domain-containing protein
MSIVAWRLVRRERANDTFSGEGARLFGGRWNSPGTAVVYTSSSLALAALETLVHINPQLPMDYVAFRVEFDSAFVETADAVLPVTWRENPPPPAAQQVGDNWTQAARSAVLSLPSALVPVERNFLLNPKHADFSRIRVEAPEPFDFDRRLPGVH